MNTRALALSMLRDYEEQGKYVNLSLSSHSTDKLTAEERELLTVMLYTTVEHKITYDYYIGALSERSLDKIDSHTRNILRLGICQIIDMDKIPDFAAVNETVKLARNSGERAFVNGVLRSVVRCKASLPMPKREKNACRYLSVRYSFPLWIVKKFFVLFGEAETEKLLSSFNEIGKTDLTVNTMKTTARELAEKMSNAGYSATPSVFSDISIRVDGSCNPKMLPGFSEGEFFVQDAACAAAISVLSPIAGERIIDVCACPGGKSFASAAIMNNQGKISACDIHESKLSLIISGAERLGFDSIKTVLCDASVGDSTQFGEYDKVICDVPCSGLGVLGKKPDIRYKSEDSLKELPELQLKILTASAKYLKAGGRLLYSTCTLNPEENLGVVERFLSENSDFHTVDFNVGNLKSENGSFTFLPHIHETDGFFVCLLEKDSV